MEYVALILSILAIINCVIINRKKNKIKNSGMFEYRFEYDQINSSWPKLSFNVGDNWDGKMSLSRIILMETDLQQFKAIIASVNGVRVKMLKMDSDDDFVNYKAELY